MALDISSLPNIGDNITEPAFDQTTTDVGKLVLQQNATINPLSVDLNNAFTGFASANSFIGGSLSQVNIQDAIDNMPVADANLTTAERNSLLADLSTIKTSMAAFVGPTQTAVNNTTSFIDHTDLMSDNIPIVAGIVGQALILPRMIQTDIPNGLPSDFSGSTCFDTVTTTFNGMVAVTAIPTLNLSDLDAVPSLPDVRTLPGIDIPGVPDPDQVLTAFGGSILSEEFGGVGVLLAPNASAFADATVTGMTPLAATVDAIQNNIGDTSALSGLVASTASTTSTFTPAMDTLAACFSEVLTAMDELVTSEQQALFAENQTVLQKDITNTCKSAFSAFGEGSSITNLITNQSGAKLISSTASTELATLLDL